MVVTKAATSASGSGPSVTTAPRRRARDARTCCTSGRGEAYFWALIAALGVFVAGAAFSLREGITELIHPTVTSSFTVAYVVLAISTVFDLVSFRQSAGQMIGRAHHYHRDLIDESKATSDPTLRAVFLEDAVSVSGDVITLAALALNQITGSSIPQGVAAVLIGLVLIRTSLRLIKRSHDFLVGAWLVTPEAREDGDADGSTTQPLTSAYIYVKAPMPVMARPTMRVCMVSVPSNVWIASMSTMCRMTW